MSDISNDLLAVEAANIITSVDQTMIHEIVFNNNHKPNSGDYYDIAEKLERARNIMLVLGDRIERIERVQKVA
jgi:hypothetical protein